MPLMNILRFPRSVAADAVDGDDALAGRLQRMIERQKPARNAVGEMVEKLEEEYSRPLYASSVYTSSSLGGDEI